MPTWLRRKYDAIGMTQFPAGPHLGVLQASFRGSVVLCIDVSGSMSMDDRTPQAVAGSHRFIDEALASRYDVGSLVFSARAIEGVLPLSADRDLLHGFAETLGGQRAHLEFWHDDDAYQRYCRDPATKNPVDMPSDGIASAIGRSADSLRGRPGDRVIAIFTDGEFFNPEPVTRSIEQAMREGIEVIMLGLGDEATRSIEDAANGEPIRAMTAAADDIADAIAGMASGLRRRSQRG